MLRKPLNLIVLSAAIWLSPQATASPTLAPYLQEVSRAPFEPIAANGFLVDDVRAEGSGFLIHGAALGGGSTLGEFMSLRTDAALQVQAVVSATPSATTFFVDGANDEWIALAVDGERHATPLGFDARVDAAVAVENADGGALFAIPTESGRLQLLAVDARSRFRWQRDAGAFANDGALFWLQRGDALLLWQQQGSDLRVSQVDTSNGQFTLNTSYTLPADATALATAIDTLGNLFALTVDQTPAPGATPRILRFDANGQGTLDQAVECSSGTTSEFDGPVLPYACGLASNGAETHWLSIESDGIHLYKAHGSDTPRDAWSTADVVPSATLGADGSSLLVVSGFGNSIVATPRLVRVGVASGAIVDPAPLAALPNVLLEPLLHEDGHAGVIVEDRNTFNTLGLRRYNADGALQWRVTLAAGRSLLDFSTAQVCSSSGGASVIDAAAEVLVNCFDLSNGSPTLTAQISDARIVGQPALAGQTSGRALAFVRDDPATDPPPIRLIEWRGAMPARTLASNYTEPLARLDSADRLIVIENGTTPKRLERFDAAGTAIAAAALPAAVKYVKDAAFDNQDRLWITYSDTDLETTWLARIDAQGAFANPTQHVIAGRSIARLVTNAFGTLLQIDRDSSPRFDGSSESTLMSIGDDGQMRWQYFARSAWPRFGAFHAGAARIDTLELAFLPELAWRLTQLDTSTGAVLANHALPWPNFSSAPFPLAHFSTERRVTYVGGATAQLTFGAVGVAPAAVVDDIASTLNGAWSIPGLGGQGLAFEYNAAIGTMSAAWYSHGSNSPNFLSHATLRWHTMLGAVPAGEAVELPLAIFENDGGAFDDLPTTQSTPAGAAFLSVTGCDQMSLRYEFGGVQEAPRSIALQRASPRTRPCTLRLPNSSQSNTAPASYLPQSDLGGVWYEQRTSGQGLHIVIYPPGAPTSHETVGLGWFTYDVADAADDFTQQHWFTASGTFDDASQQRATLNIYRTTGGDRETRATRNTHRVGAATLQRIDCDSATLSYQFDDTLVAAAFATKARTIPLQRLGVCP